MTKLEFADWLRKTIDNKGWTQAEFARRTGLSPAQITRLLNGERGVGETGLNAIATALGLPPDLVFQKANKLPPTKTNLSEEQRQVMHLVSQLDDQKTLRLILAMLDQALAEKK